MSARYSTKYRTSFAFCRDAKAKLKVATLEKKVVKCSERAKSQNLIDYLMLSTLPGLSYLANCKKSCALSVTKRTKIRCQNNLRSMSDICQIHRAVNVIGM